MIQTHFSQITPIPTTHIDTTGAVNGNAVVFNGTSYVPLFPIAAYNAGVLLGRVEEVNITGTGGVATIAGKRVNIQIDKGVNARSVSPAIGAYQAVSNIDFGAGFLTSFASGTVTVSTTAATPTIGISNGGVGVGIVVSPGASSSFVMRSIQQGSGITVTQAGDNIVISTVAGGGLVGVNGNGLSVTPNTVSLALASISSAGAMPQLNGVGTNYLAGDGTFKPLPSASGVTSFNMATGAVQLVNGTNTTVVSLGSGQFRIDAAGGGGGVTSVTTGNGAVLSVSPTNGNVVVTPIGLSTTLNSAYNTTTKILSVPVPVYQGGILLSASVANFDLSGAGGGGGGTVEVRKDGVTINPAAAILNFIGAGVSVANGVGTEITISGGGSGVTSFNSSTGAINLISGTNTNVVPMGGGTFRIDATGGGGGGSLIGYSGNGLSVFPDNVSLAIATTVNAGAMPVLSGNSAQYLSGAGTWVNVPSGGGAVNQVTSGNMAVLTVTPTTGNVVITPNGLGGSFTPSFNVGTKTLSLQNTTHNGGILTTQGTTFIDLSSLSSSVNITSTNGLVVTPSGANVQVNMPNGTMNRTMRYNGTAWEETPGLQVFSNGDVTMGANFRLAVRNANETFQFGSGFSPTIVDRTFAVQFGTSLVSPFVPPRQGGFYLVGSNANNIVFEANLLFSELGFFGATPIARPSTTNDITSVRNALIALGLIS